MSPKVIQDFTAYCPTTNINILRLLHNNSLIKHVFSICNVEESGIIIPGSTANSDLSASVAFIKNKLRAKLQANQKTGRVTEW